MEDKEDLLIKIKGIINLTQNSRVSDIIKNYSSGIEESLDLIRYIYYTEGYCLGLIQVADLEEALLRFSFDQSGLYWRLIAGCVWGFLTGYDLDYTKTLSKLRQFFNYEDQSDYYLLAVLMWRVEEYKKLIKLVFDEDSLLSIYNRKLNNKYFYDKLMHSRYTEKIIRYSYDSVNFSTDYKKFLKLLETENSNIWFIHGAEESIYINDLEKYSGKMPISLYLSLKVRMFILYNINNLGIILIKHYQEYYRKRTIIVSNLQTNITYSPFFLELNDYLVNGAEEALKPYIEFKENFMANYLGGKDEGQHK